MTKQKTLTLFLAALVFITSNETIAQQKTYPIDDSGTYVLEPMVKMEWDDLIPIAGKQSSTIRGKFYVQLKLDTKALQGKQGRIFITLQPTPFGEVQAFYRPGGELIDGEVRTTQRGLIYTGLFPDRFDEKVLFEIVTDGRKVVRPEEIEFKFVAEVF